MAVVFSKKAPEDDNPFAKYNYTRRKRQSDVWLRLGKIVGPVLVLGLIFLLWKSSAFRSKSTNSVARGPHKASHDMHDDAMIERENATLVMLVRNRELTEALRSMRQIEDRFNHKYHYPWTFLNDEPFTTEFRLYTSGMASGDVEYGLIDKQEWSTPPWIDTEKAQAAMEEMVRKDVIYGGSVSYRHMCRYNSGFFWRHPLVNKYAWYWRVEPDIDFYCSISYDPFTYMRENEKEYGFVIALPEYWDTIPTLWDTTRQFCRENPQFVAKNNSLNFIVDDEKGWDGVYNGCHFWSNFEIASLDFWRGDAYSKYFEYLDKSGGFYYERWGDAPVHSLAAALFLPVSKIHWFGDVGYRHNPWTHCPVDDLSHHSGRCLCDRNENFDENGWSCLPKWWKLASKDM